MADFDHRSESRLARCAAAIGSEGRAARISLCNCSSLITMAARRMGPARELARRDAETCSVVKIGWKLCGLTLA